jgi:hypothetical protein
MEEEFIKIDGKGEPEDVLISLRKLLQLINHQVNYYGDKMKEHEENAHTMYILNQPDEKYKELIIKQEEWKWLHEHLIQSWPSLLIN